MIAELSNYLQSHKGLRAALMAAGFFVASVSLYMAIAAYLFIQYSNFLIAVLLLATLGFDVGIAWLAQQNARRSFGLTIMFTSAAIAVGTTTVSMLILRGHWASTVKELLRELL